ncbi:MAG TPA: hypothetical protein VED01_15660 [Burkholderiales bacterium]|nr:hypothetical protein [Burkholderiales bacterium]
MAEVAARDNRCVLHRTTTFDKTKYRRKLHRTNGCRREPRQRIRDDARCLTV